MKDPYEVLGINHGASQSEIKAAYRELVKKYHPDRYQGNPLADLAEEKLREVNDAYEQLTSGKASSYGTGEAYSAADNGYGAYGSYSASGSYIDVRAAINSGQMARAEQLLDNCKTHDAEWYFLSGIVSYRKGYLDDGLAKVRTAMSMEPDNIEYSRIYHQMTGGGMAYRGAGDMQGYGGSAACAQCIECYCCSSLISPCW